MQVVDHERSEIGPQRRKSSGGRLLHCCCICGEVSTWGAAWSTYCSAQEEEEGVPIPKFCSKKCAKAGGDTAENVTEEMKRKAKDAEWREPETAWREANESEKFNAAMARQRTVRRI